LSATSTVTVVVKPTLATIIVSPASINVPAAGKEQFKAAGDDQFGNPMSTQPAFSWSV
jgi:hypothetical protein